MAGQEDRLQPVPVEVEHVDHVAVHEAVDDVADRAAQDAGQREREQALARMRAQQPDDEAGRPRPSAVNSQRCQPPAAARKENAAPGLCTRTRLKKPVTTVASLCGGSWPGPGTC